LWAGLPVLTCRARAFGGRVAASLLGAVGLPELVTDSLEAYEAQALRLARDASLLAELRGRLAPNRLTHPLFHSGPFCRHIEAAYTTMWELSQRDASPQSFSVEPQKDIAIRAPTERTEISLLLNEAIRVHQQGRLEEAEKLYSGILSTSPDHFDATHLL